MRIVFSPMGDKMSNMTDCSTVYSYKQQRKPLQWRHNGHDGVSNHQPHDCLLNRYSSTDQRTHQSSASLAFVWGIHRDRWIPPHKGPVTRKMFPFDDVIMHQSYVLLALWEGNRWPLHLLWKGNLPVTGDPPVTGGFPSQRASIHMPWRHHATLAHYQQPLIIPDIYLLRFHVDEVVLAPDEVSIPLITDKLYVWALLVIS